MARNEGWADDQWPRAMFINRATLILFAVLTLVIFPIRPEIP